MSPSRATTSARLHAMRVRGVVVVVALACASLAAPGALLASCTGSPTVPKLRACLQVTDCLTGEICREGTCVGSIVGPERDVVDAGGGDVSGDGGPGTAAEGEGEGDAHGEGEGEGALQVQAIFAPSALTMPSTDVASPVSASAQLVNVGTGSLVVDGFDASDARFAIVSPIGLPQTIAAGGQLAVTVRFAPAAAGTASTTVTARAAGTALATLAVDARATSSAPTSTRLVARAGPDDAGIGLPGCVCLASFSPANINLAYVAPDATSVSKPADLSCGLDDSCAATSLGRFGQARWRAGRVEARANEEAAPWIVDEEVVHEGTGDDGVFSVNATLGDDCIALPGSLSANVNNGCCLVDRDGAQRCYDHSVGICPTLAQVATTTDCMARGDVLVRARVQLDVEHDFCATFAAGEQRELVRVRRTGGNFTIEAPGAGVVEVAAGAACP